ncbi:MAG: OFA family MFS transporter [Treponema sp.]|jgi:MFS family permease|nr:OFA family MFS transporter [Treponema sp.]
MILTKSRWLVLGASCLINLCIGLMYAWSVFVTPMAEHLSSIIGRQISSLAVVFTVANSVGPVTMISGGFINDKLGPRWVIFAGGVLFGFGMFFSGFASSVGSLILTFGLGCGLGMGLVYGCTVSNTVKFFPDHRGLAGGLSTASFGISSVIVPPVANFLMQSFGVTTTFKILGIFIFLFISILAFFITPCPSGFVPEGWKPVRNVTAKAGKEKNWKGMLLDPAFYIMLFLLCCGAFSGIMVISQASPVAQRMTGMTVTSAAAVVSTLALLNTCGRVIAGFLFDKLGIVKTLLGIFTLSIVGLLALYLSKTGDILKFYTGIAAVGFAFGSIMGVFPAFTAFQFGAKNNSMNYGIMFTGFAVAGLFGPTIMSSIYSLTGNYRYAFFVAICLSVSGIALLVIYRLCVRLANKL